MPRHKARPPAQGKRRETETEWHRQEMNETCLIAKRPADGTDWIHGTTALNYGEESCLLYIDENCNARADFNVCDSTERERGLTGIASQSWTSAWDALII